MTASKKKQLMMMAVMVLVVLILLLSSFIWLRLPMFEVKDGAIVVPDPADVFTTTTSQSVEVIPEELSFKGTFTWEEKDGARPEDNSTFYLRIYTYDGDTLAKFSFGEYLIDGWPIFLVSHTGERYILESSTNSLVERVRITVDITDTGMSGTVENITPDISNFVRGDFVGESISYEQYAAEVLN